MSSSTSPSYAKIGLTVFLGVLAIVGTLVYLGGARGRAEVFSAETYFNKSVSGLSVGSPVNFRGVKLGEVSEIGFVSEHYRVGDETNLLVYVKMDFPRREMEGYEFEGEENMAAAPDAAFRGFIDRLQIRATVTASGITGLSRIELDSHPDVAPMPISWTPRHVYVPPAVSLLDSFSDSATRVMNQINKIDITGIWSNIAVTVRSVSQILEGTQAVVESRQGEIEKVMSDLSACTGALREMAEDLKANPALLLRERVREPLPETAR